LVYMAKANIDAKGVASMLWPFFNDELVKPTLRALAKVALAPDEYTRWVNIDQLECDTVIHKPKLRKFVELMKDKKMRFPPIQAIKHPLWPKVKRYAVLNGHHRYFAYRVLKRKRIQAILVEGGSYGILYELTKRGVFQVNDTYQAVIRNPIEKIFRKKFDPNYDVGY